ncbi:MAG: OmpA family protein [Gammaproteobacteria bacterium]
MLEYARVALELAPKRPDRNKDTFAGITESMNTSSEPSSPRHGRAYWRRRDDESHSSLDSRIGIALLVLLTIFVASVFLVPEHIESSVGAAVEKTLQRAGMASLDVKMDGQDVFISGQVVGDDLKRDIAKLHAIARGATCEVAMVGDLVCPAKVYVTLEQLPSRNPPTNNDPDPSAQAPQTASMASEHNFSLEKKPDFLIITGAIPNAKVRDLMLKRATQAGLSVIDNMHITGQTPTEYFPWAVERAWKIVGYLENGDISWRNGRFSVAGQITSEDEAAVENAYSSALFQDQLAGLKLDVRPVYNEVSTCNQAVAEVLEYETLEFNPQSAELVDASQVLLDRLAVLIEQCTLPFTVENHTEVSAQPEKDLALSQARAEAIVAALVARGVDKNRLTPRGFGGSLLKKNNNTPIARMQNRRTIVVAKQQ